MKVILLTIILFLLVTIFIYIDIIPYIIRKLNKPIFFKSDYESFVSKVVDISLKMAKSPKVEMILDDNKDFISGLSNIITKLKKSNNKTKEWTYNFPKAFLILGLHDFYVNKNYEEINTIANFYLNEFKNRSLKFDCLMRIPYALFFLKVYQKTQNSNLLIPVHEAYSKLLEWKCKDNIIYYFRKGKHMHANLHYVDGIGMYIPFLVEYYKTFNNLQAITIAKENMDYFINYGTDTNYLPFHNIYNNIKLGPNNWGRGISWFILGLISLFEIDEKYFNYGNKLLDTLEKLQKEKFIWSQFPGASYKTDSSATIPFLLLYVKLKRTLNESDLEDLRKTLIKLTLENGKIYYNSGDTRDINTYSKEFSTSEFTQGILLTLITSIENK